MFGRKKQTIKSDQIETQNLQTIPEDFYGGKDPVVHFQEVEMKNKVPAKLPKMSGKDFKSDKFKLPKISFVKNKIFIYIILGVLFLLAVGAITWYYLDQAGLISKKEPVAEVKMEEESATKKEISDQNLADVIAPDLDFIEEVVLEDLATSTETEVVDTPISLEEQAIDFPRIISTDSVDVDNDSLTDIEEETFATDSGSWDTDNDGYYDGQEVVNLYNPKGIAPVKLIDSGLIQEYVNPNWQYRIYFPITWERGVVDNQARQVLFSSITGDFVEVLTYDLEPNEDFISWFARKAEGQQYTDIIKFKNRFSEDGYKRRDGLVAYFLTDKNIYVIVYYPGVTGFVSFRHTVEMMINSFRPSKTIFEIPDQVVLPSAPDYDIEPVTPSLEDIVEVVDFTTSSSN